jgi:hypothetical protein
VLAAICRVSQLLQDLDKGDPISGKMKQYYGLSVIETCLFGTEETFNVHKVPNATHERMFKTRDVENLGWHIKSGVNAFL